MNSCSPCFRFGARLNGCFWVTSVGFKTKTDVTVMVQFGGAWVRVRS